MYERVHGLQAREMLIEMFIRKNIVLAKAQKATICRIKTNLRSLKRNFSNLIQDVGSPNIDCKSLIDGSRCGRPHYQYSLENGFQHKQLDYMVISYGNNENWPTRLYYLTPLNIFLLSFLKQLVYPYICHKPQLSP